MLVNAAGLDIFYTGIKVDLPRTLSKSFQCLSIALKMNKFVAASKYSTHRIRKYWIYY